MSVIYRNFLRALGRGGAAPGQGSSQPSAHLLDVALAVVQSADVIPRSPDDEGPRIAVISPSLGGAFYWCRDEARRRVENHFNLSERDTLRVVNALGARVKLAAQPSSVPRRRGGFVNAWRDQPNLDCFE